MNEHLDVIKNMIKDSGKEIITIFCVGTNRLVGDSLGPMVGTMIENSGIMDVWENVNIIGTLDEPVHALNIEYYIETIPEGSYVIAVDTSLGKYSDVGLMKVKNKPLRPGSGVGKDLPKVGNLSVTGIVGVVSKDCINSNYESLLKVKYTDVKILANNIVELIVDILGGNFEGSYGSIDIENIVINKEYIEKDIVRYTG